MNVDDGAVSEIRRLEEAVHKAEDGGLRARWASGHYLRGLKSGRKQLRPGLLKELAKELQVNRSELSARMKFAEKCPTEQELSDAIGKHKTWFAIVHDALTTKPRKEAHVEHDVEQSEVGSNRANLRRATSIIDNIIDNIDAEELDAKDIERLLEAVVRLKTSVAELAAA